MRSISAKRRKKRRERKIKSGGFEVSNFRGGDLVQFETNTKRKLRDLETQKFRFQGTLKRRFLPFFYKNVSKSLYLFISLISCFDMCYKRCVLTFTCMDSDISASGDLVLLERVESSVDVLPR